MHVLIADDDREALAFLKGCLKAWGHTVTTAPDGEAACKAVLTDPGITVAILNWMMPRMDGWRLSRDLKAAKSKTGRGGGTDVYTIVVVGLPFCKVAKETFGSWADEYISKPFDVQDLRAQLDTAAKTVGPLVEDARMALPAGKSASGAPAFPHEADVGSLLRLRRHPYWN